MESSVTWSQFRRRLTDKTILCCQKSKKLMSKIQDLPICFCLTKSFHSSPVQTLVPRYAAENLSDWRVLSFLYLPEFIFKKKFFQNKRSLIKFTPVAVIHTKALHTTNNSWLSKSVRKKFDLILFVCFFWLILTFHNFSWLIKKVYLSF